ncbi:MAG: FAD-dependent monooxygenase [Deinococcus sp.]|nr:FAD-dependent monooxygenase [Deinococcus sp.]
MSLTTDGRRGEKRLLIVGGGIAGLTLGRALQQVGLAFDLIERAPQPAGGAGIMLGWNAVQLLASLGLEQPLLKLGQRFEQARIVDPQGRALQTVSLPQVHPHAYGLGLFRPDLHRTLAAGLPVKWGVALEGLHIEAGAGGVRVQLSGGEERHYAAVIGADGLHSRVREQGFGVAGPVYSGYTCWRFVAESPLALAPTEWWGAGRRIGLVATGQGRVYGYATLNAPAGKHRDAAGSAALLRRLFADFALPLALPETDAGLIHHDLYELRRHHWVRGPLALVGDAAHAMTPNLGQGAALGIEDAAVLARALQRYSPGPHAFAVYEQVRRNRVAALARTSRILGRAGQWEHPLLVTLRNASLASTPQWVPEAQLRGQLVGPGTPRPTGCWTKP